MIKTNLTQYESDLMEVVNEFSSVDSTAVSLIFSEGEKVNITVTVGKSVYPFTYDFLVGDQLNIKRLTKRYAKLSLYKALSAHTGVSLPWGALTGIRPTKLAYAQEDYKSFFLDTMCVSKEKTALIGKILETQKGIYDTNPDNCGLFVSVPFCPTRCAYCSFISNEISKEKRINEYIDGLIKEIEAAKPLIKNLRGVYVGGGTPVALDDENFSKLLSAIGPVDVEYTVEAGRPDAITKRKLEIMKAHGVTRVCVNPQTFSNKTLALIGRRHTAEDIIEKYRLVKSFGFTVNMDLIAGLPEEGFEDFKASLETAISLDPDNITVHTLCLKKGSRLKEATDRLTAGEVAKMVDFSHDVLQKSGYRPYYLYRQKYMAGNLENTGYAKPGAECVYNIDIMEETTDVLACGANAITKKVLGGAKKLERIGAPKDVGAYLLRLDQIIKEKNYLFGQK